MKKKLLYISIFISLSFIQAQQDKLTCSMAKQLRGNNSQKTDYDGDTNIDISYYKLEISINTSGKQIDGKVTIKSSCVSSSIEQYYLDLNNSMEVISVSFNSTPAEYQHINNKIIISPASALRNGDVFTTVIEYSGQPVSSGFGSFQFSNHNGTPVIWSLSQPYGARNWWPCKDTPSDKADSADIWITCSSDLIPVSNGKLIDIDVINQRLHTYKWKCEYPIAQYLISIAVTNYHLYENKFLYNDDQDTMTLTHYSYPENFTEQRKESYDETVNMLRVFSDMFGLYPFVKEKYGHAEFSWGGGMEHQTISSMGAYFTGIVSHELAHQWFGDKITCADWQNVWLNEGFATYCEALYSESISGKEIYDNMINNEMNYARNANGSLYVEDVSTTSSIFDYSRSYAKGAVVLHMLRGVLGDETFFKSLHSYSNDAQLAYSTATTEDFQRVVESVSGIDLNYFFDEWIYGENYPVYILTWDYSGSDGNYSVKIDLSQQVNSSPEFFTMPVDIKIVYEDSDTTVTIWNDKSNQLLNLASSRKPVSIVLDPGNKILKDVIYLREQMIPTDFNVTQNYPNPFNPTTKIIYSLPSRSDVTITIYNTAGQLVHKEVLTNSPAGKHIYSLNMTSIGYSPSSGIYIYRVNTDSGSIARKMVFIK